ncbi:unnamed protein product [Arctogadus glacialis]
MLRRPLGLARNQRATASVLHPDLLRGKECPTFQLGAVDSFCEFLHTPAGGPGPPPPPPRSPRCRAVTTGDARYGSPPPPATVPAALYHPSRLLGPGAREVMGTMVVVECLCVCVCACVCVCVCERG